MGLLNLGVSVGNWAKGQQTLENHLIGDPTFRFLSSETIKTDLNEAVTLKKGDVKLWKKLLKSPNAEVKSLAMKMLYRNHAITTGELLNIQKEEKRATVRLMAFNLLRNAADKNLIAAIKLGLYDNYELIRRLSALCASMNGSPLLIDDVFTLLAEPGVTKRVAFQLKGASDIYPEEEAMAAYQRALNGKKGKWAEDQTRQMNTLKASLENRDKEFSDLLKPDVSLKAKKFTVTALRNSCDPSNLNLLFSYYQGLTTNEEKITLIEALGWYQYSHKKEEIKKFCHDQLSAEKEEPVRQELIRTLTRLK